MPQHTRKEKAKKILREGQIGGKKLTDKQQRFFGFLAGGGTPTRKRDLRQFAKRK
ncbi:MAG: hypothetical protein ACRDGA_05045 [Bacteroidota bacterium]